MVNGMENLLNSFYEGDCINAYEYFGAHLTHEYGKDGVRFSVCAPHASHVQLIGEFNEWYGADYEMKKLDNRGTYTLFVSNAKVGMMYKYRIFNSDGSFKDKQDPYAFYSELRPGTASIIADIDNSCFSDEKWIQNRTKNYDKPVSIYELHFGSWKQKHIESDDVTERWYKYDEICDDLIKYLKDNNFTHIELMPLSEYPLDASWGYQVSGYFSTTSRYGNCKQLMHLVNKCHNNNIGVILDYVPVHFVGNDYSLYRFDGTPMYEYQFDEVSKSVWGSCNFDFFNKIVRSFLLSAAVFWLDVFHFDGLRLDAISSALYWQGNSDRGINVGAVDLLKTMNTKINEKFNGIMMMAEDSSVFPNVTKPVSEGGLGFDYKWDLGWMNDTLRYFSMHPYDRIYEHKLINFSMMYYYSERFLMPFSHDEVVHGKGTILNKMYGTYEEKFMQAKTLYTYMFTHPGKKLNFMGNELGHFREWDENKELDWNLLDFDAHRKFNKFFKDLNKLYEDNDALYERDYKDNGFKWIDANDNEHRVFSYIRKSEKETLVIAFNAYSEDYPKYTLGFDENVKLKEIFNTDNSIYGGENRLNNGIIKTKEEEYKNYKYSCNIHLAPFSAVIFKVL